MNEPFIHRHRVTYAECTIGDHVYYARYLDILEEARGEFFRHINEPFRKWQSHNVMFPVTEVQLKYKGAARYDDVLDVRLSITQLTRIRLQFCHEISKDGIVLVEGLISHVCTTLDEKPQRMPVELHTALSNVFRTSSNASPLL